MGKYKDVMIYLAQDGASVNLRFTVAEWASNKVDAEKAHYVHPVLLKGTEVAGHVQVLWYLQAIKNNAECQQYLSHLKHENTVGYTGVDGVFGGHNGMFKPFSLYTHDDTLEQMIEFVKAKMEEEKCNQLPARQHNTR